MTRMLVVRHGESEWNAQGRWQGWADPELSPQGRVQAASAADKLEGFRGHVIASDLRRAAQTAHIIAGRLGLDEPTLDAGLREIDLGQWTGLTSAQIEARFPGELAGWRALRVNRPRGGEHRDELTSRVLGVLHRVAGEHPATDVLVVTHGGVIHALERHLGLHEVPGVGNLGGRWLVAASPLRADGERLQLF